MFGHDALKKPRVHPSCALTTTTSKLLRAKRHKLHENRDHPKKRARRRRRLSDNRGLSDHAPKGWNDHVQVAQDNVFQI